MTLRFSVRFQHDKSGTAVQVLCEAIFKVLYGLESDLHIFKETYLRVLRQYADYKSSYSLRPQRKGRYWHDFAL